MYLYNSMIVANEKAEDGFNSIETRILISKDLFNTPEYEESGLDVLLAGYE